MRKIVGELPLCNHFSLVPPKHEKPKFAASGAQEGSARNKSPRASVMTPQCCLDANGKFELCSQHFRIRTQKRSSFVERTKQSPQYQLHMEMHRRCPENPDHARRTPNVSPRVSSRTYETEAKEWRQFLRSYLKVENEQKSQ